MQHSDAFQRYVQSSLVPGIARGVSDLVDLFVSATDDSLLGENVLKRNQPSDFSCLLQKQSSKLVSEHLKILCRSNFQFVCFVARVTAERCRALHSQSLLTDSVGAHAILSPVCVALQQIFDLNEEMWIRLWSCVMKSRTLALQRISNLTLVSEPMSLRLTSGASVHPIECNARKVITVVRELITQTDLGAEHQSLVTNALMFEVQQLLKL